MTLFCIFSSHSDFVAVDVLVSFAACCAAFLSAKCKMALSKHIAMMVVVKTNEAIMIIVIAESLDIP